MKKYIVRMEQLVKVGKAAAYRIRHANILLAVDESALGPKLKDDGVARALNVSVGTIEALRRRLVEKGLEVALDRKKPERPSIEPMFDGENEAQLIALACGPKP